MTLRWFRFSAPQGGHWYGYGTEAEAAEYARRVAPVYSAVPPSEVLPSAVDCKAFSIREALRNEEDEISRAYRDEVSSESVTHVR